jgi:hypothetical protein
MLYHVFSVWFLGILILSEKNQKPSRSEATKHPTKRWQLSNFKRPRPARAGRGAQLSNFRLREAEGFRHSALG